MRLKRCKFLTCLLLRFCFFASIFYNVPYLKETLAQPAAKTPKVDPTHYQPSASPCYDDRGNPQRCVPDFINAAFNLEVEATNTCGVRQPTRFCIQTGHMGIKKDCDICDARVPAYSHPATYLTDFNNPNNETWWQSETMADRMQYPRSINLTLRLGKAYDITYVRLKFISPRPESFVIYKKEHSSDDWITWQYYSGSCRLTFGMEDRKPILPNDEAVAQCTREFSDISPLTGGNIAFSTLEGRPSAENFEESETLQKWVTATEIMISLVRMNTFGDEIFQDRRVLESYWYGISDFAVGGRCKCNGHANQCVKSTSISEGEQLVCECQHNTKGVDCQECKPFFVDRPWKPATSTEANECLPCNCNGLSERCFFDAKLFEETGHGGHCIDCTGNTHGPHCDKCAPNHWRRPNEKWCTACQCSEIGSIDGQCDDMGQCKCKPGVTGQRCDRCAPGFFDFGVNGCQDCHCDPSGSFNNTPNCSPATGACVCKTNVESQRCDKCKPGYFQLSSKNFYGCTPCFCFGHSSVCSPAEGYFAMNITSDFHQGVESWSAGSELRREDTQWATLDKAVAVSQSDDYPVYFQAPAKFLGDLRFSYDKLITFDFRVQQGNSVPSKKDVIIVGANGQEISAPIFAQSNPVPELAEQHYAFRLHANQHLQWGPNLRETDFIALLSNVSAFKIRGTYSRGDVGFLSNFHIESASLVTPTDVVEPADWIETCKCTEGFVGQFCESCAHGYKRAMKFGGPLAKCIKCDCHGHSESCDAESGVCICQHNTDGETCERCARGWYGDALVGTDSDCNKCDCPENGPCMMMDDGETLCTECPDGYTGRKCELCADEYFGNPAIGQSCKKCNCNENTDPNAIGKCDTVSGECRRCIYHTIGWECEECAAGYWGDALAEVKGDCKPCHCHTPGTIRPSADYDVLRCRQSDGQCSCQSNVIGLRCEFCEDGYFNLTSGNGCQRCECDIIGSVNGGCDEISGQCRCKPGVTGRQCNECAAQHYGFSVDGCKPCDCDLTGSETMNCDPLTGQCLCKTNVEGRRCDQCAENRYNLNAGCLACDDCYTLIQHRKNEINGTVSRFRDQLDDIQNNPAPVNDAEFNNRVDSVRQSVESLKSKANEKLEGDDSKIRNQVERMKGQLSEAELLIQAIQKINFPKIDQNSADVESQLRRFKHDKEATQRELDAGISFVTTQGQQQLDGAKQAAGRYGERSQQLSDLAFEAKTLADKQDQRRRNILALAEEISNISRSALSDTNEAIFGVSSTSQQIYILHTKINEVQQKLTQLQVLIDEQSVVTNQTNNEAARMLSDIESVRLPNIVPEELHESAQRVNINSSKDLNNVREKATKNAVLLVETEKVLREMYDKLQNAINKQKFIDKSYEEVDVFNARAKSSFDLATKTWNEAKDTHDSLADFYSKVEQSKQEAMDELLQLSEIQKELNEAGTITQEAENAVGDAKNDADQSLQLSTEAKLKAENLANESEKLEVITDETNTEASRRRQVLDTLAKEIDSLSATTKDFENQATSDTEQSNDVLRRATLAESTAKSLQERLNGSERKLAAALDQLNSLENVDDAQLSELEMLLVEAERRYESSESEKQMKERIRKMELEVASEKRQIDALTKELNNLKGIRDSLPTKCYNLVNLEQEGQR